MKEKIVNILQNSIVKNSIKTFLQGFFGALAVTITNADLSNKAVVLSTLIGATSSGICAVSDYILKRKGDKNETESEVE